MRRTLIAFGAALVLSGTATATAATPHDRLERAVGTVVECVDVVDAGTTPYTVAPYRIRLWDAYCAGIHRTLGPARPLDAAAIQGWAQAALVYQAVTCQRFGNGCTGHLGGEYWVNVPNVVPRLLADAGLKGRYARQIVRQVQRLYWGTP